MPINKRKHLRTPIEIGILPPAMMTLFKPFFHEPFEVHIRDLSAGGMKLTSPEVLPLFFDFGLEFHLPGTELIQAKAKAVHQLKTDDGYDIGVLFTEIEDSVRDLLNALGTDYNSCEDRIRAEEREVCRESCRFLLLCQKNQKTF